MIKKVMFVPRHTIETVGPWHDWALISIDEPDAIDGPAKLHDGWYSTLKLSFHDVTLKSHGMDALIRHCSKEDARKIVDFVRGVAPEIEGVIIHCRAGKSRSAAVAKWICGEYRIDFSSSYENYNNDVYELLLAAAGRAK